MTRLALASIAVFCVVACTESHSTIDANVDTGALDGAAHTHDARVDVGPHDGGLCTPERLTASCEYRGYGTTCHVPCDFPPTCAFTVTVTWTGGYCCGVPTESFDDCVCVSGAALCRPAFTPLDRMLPITYCEFCERPDTGFEDAGTDGAADDAGPEDASTDG